ncbi:UbiA family prenyltransferase [Streptacidiphilus monticola]|uniref:UbiA family prenyltransferase n=1 Tax=Streptacidiphilus monticola TaxID=2161674 RepID=A0ABW1GC71_9ACTN
MFLARFVVAALLSSPDFRPGIRLVAGALAWTLATMAIYVFNGIADRVEDRANGSTRPISSGRLAVPHAVGGALAAGLLGLPLGLFAGGPAELVPLLAFLAAGYAYSGAPFRGKRHGASASALVLVLGAATYAGGWCVGGRGDTSPVLVLGAAMSLWMALVGAVVKDLSDVEGDRVAGRRTPVIVWGQTPTRIVASANALLVGGGYLAAALCWAPALAPSAGVVLGGAAVLAVLTALTRHSIDRGERRRPYRAFMVTQYLAHALALLWLAAN